jgi:hypothetical protein
LQDCEVRVFDDDGCLEMRTPVETRAHVEHPVPVEGRTIDEDGMPVQVLLFAPRGLLAELEFNRVDGNPPVKLPPPSEWTVRINRRSSKMS